MSDDDELRPHAAFTKFDEHTYISGIWIFDYPSFAPKYLGNVFAQLFRPLDGEWHMNVIQRTYVDEKVYGSEDRKQYFQKKWPGDTPENQVIKEVDEALRGLCTVLSGVDYTHLKVHGDVDKWFEVAKLDHRLHIAEWKKEEPDEGK